MPIQDWEPATLADANDPIVSSIDRLIEWLDHYLSQDDRAEAAIVVRGYPDFTGKLPLQKPRIAIYETAGSRTESPGYDDIAGVTEIGSEKYIRTGIYHLINVLIDVYTSKGTPGKPALSGGIITRDRLKGKIINLLEREYWTLPEDMEVETGSVLSIINDIPTGNIEQDLLLGRVELTLRVQAFYSRQIL